MGVEKINTSGYHTQTNDLVEKFNTTLKIMIAKSCGVQKKEWDVYLSYILFAYQVIKHINSSILFKEVNFQVF